jgi:enamine deaminase RidA (YjgF/YER057c/UK114 family)
VAGSGDLRRVGELVSETFTEHKLNLPVLSVVQVGMLPLEGAQIVIESTAMAKKDVNDFGLAYISAQGSSSAGPLDPVLPLAKQSLEHLATAVHAAGSEPADVLRVTCFLSSLDKFAEVRGLVASAYSSAALDFMQVRRAPTHGLAECEAVARLRSNSSAAMHVINPEGLPQSPQLSQVAVIGAPLVVLTSSQQAFGYQDADARLAFQRLQKSLSQEDGSLSRAAFVSFYPLSSSISAQVRKISAEFCDRARPPAGTLLPFEGLPSIDSGFAMDVVAVKE